jgi:hypothetical protein
MYGLKRSKKDESGLIQGAGTGTSDDIKKHIPAGSYIMPADSTNDIGEDVLKEIGEPKAEESKESLASEKSEMKADDIAEGEMIPMAKGMPKGKGKDKGIPVNVSNGEFELTPKQVHAIGVQVLNQMKNATHTNVTDQQGFGLKPELFLQTVVLCHPVHTHRLMTYAVLNKIELVDLKCEMSHLLNDNCQQIPRHQ